MNEEEIEELRDIDRLRRRFPNNYPFYFLKGGNWNEETYQPKFTISMNGFQRREIPNIIKLSTPFGRLKSMMETAAIISEIEEERVKNR